MEIFMQEKKEKVVVFGAGNAGHMVSEIIGSSKIAFYIDNDISKHEKNSYPNVMPFVSAKEMIGDMAVLIAAFDEENVLEMRAMLKKTVLIKHVT